MPIFLVLLISSIFIFSQYPAAGQQLLNPDSDSITIQTDRTYYVEGDTVRISGHVSEKVSIFPVMLMLYAPDGTLVDTEHVSVSNNNEFSYEYIAIGYSWQQSGLYKLVATYGPDIESEIGIKFTADTQYTPPSSDTGPDITPPIILKPKELTFDSTSSRGAYVILDVKAIDNEDGVLTPVCNPKSGSFFVIGETEVNCAVKDTAVNIARTTFIVTVRDAQFAVPIWIKDVAGFWCNDEIDEDSFVEAIQYLIDSDVIHLPPTEKGSSGSPEIPDWIKNNACWWYHGMISEGEFVSAIQFLVARGLLNVY